MDDRARLARFGGERHDMAMGERVHRFLLPLAGRLRREVPDAQIDLESTGEPIERAVLAVAVGTSPALRARMGYDAGAIDGSVSVGRGAVRKRDLENRLMELAREFPEVAVYDADDSTLRFGSPAGDVRLGEIAFLLLREAGRALAALIGLAGP